MLLPKEITKQFEPVIEHVKRTHLATKSSGAAVFVIHLDKVVSETYLGTSFSFERCKSNTG
jgi:hypothetical protein